MRAPLSSPRRRDALGVFLVALAVRFAMVAWAAGRFPPAGDGTYYHRLAQRLADGHGYTWLWPDGAVSYAAHYPVGYPALLSGPYALFGAEPVVAMALGAWVGALGAVAAWRLAAVWRRRGLAVTAGLMVALHPGLVGYTAALMTEGFTASLWAVSAALVATGRARRKPVVFGIAAAVTLGLATLVRPQSVLLAPALGAALFWRASLWRRAIAAVGVSVVTLFCCLPWTLRNCERMGHCALVSVNGGWNLLIGTQPEGGGWAPLQVPPGCETVYDEAEKDRCFGRAARARIASAPGAWLALVPEKLAATFDVCAAPAWYLNASNGEGVGTTERRRWRRSEMVYERWLLLLALVGLGGLERRGVVLAAVGVVSALHTHATVAFLVLAVLPWLTGRWRSTGALLGSGAILATALVHAVFFGGGRYQLVLWALLAVPAARGADELWRRVRSWRERRAPDRPAPER